MGLPVWRVPSDSSGSNKTNESADPTASARSPIRRRPGVHNRHSMSRARHVFYQPPSFQRTSSLHAVSRSHREARRADANDSYLPPVQNLLESARVTSSASPPPPVPDSPNSERRSAFTEHLSVPDDAVSYDWRRPTPRPAHNVLEETTSPSGDGTRTALHEPIGPPSSSSRPMSRSGQPASRSLPTPPRDTSNSASPQDGPSSEDEFYYTWLDESTARTDSLPPRPSHPLRHFWLPGSPLVDGLGDRTRSPSPNWEQIHSTIPPDETLPSSESSFASTAASRSFDSNGASTPATNHSNSQMTTSTTTRTSSELSELPSALPESVYSDLSPAMFGDIFYQHACRSPEGQHAISQTRYEIMMRGNPSERSIGLELYERVHGRFHLRRFGGRETLSRELNEALRVIQCWYHRNYHDGQRADSEPNRVRDEIIQRQASLAHPPARAPRATDASSMDFRSELQRLEQQNRLRRVEMERDLRRLQTTGTTPFDMTSSHRPDRDIATLSPHIAHSRAYEGGRSRNRNEAPGAAISHTPSSASATSFADPSIAADLSSLRDIVSRLAQRDDIPHEAWTEIGVRLERVSAADAVAVGQWRQAHAYARQQ